jgi:hypothetical protein
MALITSDDKQPNNVTWFTNAKYADMHFMHDFCDGMLELHQVNTNISI